MKQVIFGAGRVGANMARYAAYLGCAVETVSRAMAEDRPDETEARLAGADVVALATPDRAIGPMLSRYRAAMGDAQVIHFAGALTFKGAASVHPLYSFPRAPLAVGTLAAIPFAVEPGATAFDDLYPGARNPTFVVAQEDRAFYHALAVVSGNFAAHLFNETARVFADAFPDAPRDALAAYFDGVAARFAENPTSSMTGPLARRDPAAVAVNLDALAPTPGLHALYQAFLKSAWPDFARPAPAPGPRGTGPVEPPE